MATSPWLLNPLNVKGKDSYLCSSETTKSKRERERGRQTAISDLRYCMKQNLYWQNRMTNNEKNVNNKQKNTCDRNIITLRQSMYLVFLFLVLIAMMCLLTSGTECFYVSTVHAHTQYIHIYMHYVRISIWHMVNEFYLFLEYITDVVYDKFYYRRYTRILWKIF